MAGGPSGLVHVDSRTSARWRAEAERRGMTLDSLVYEAVEAWLGHGWDGTERRRDRRSLLEVTGTPAVEHRHHHP